MAQMVIFGGTFDPVHNGHIQLARSAKNMLHADKVLLIPAAVSPHKSNTTTASAQDRLAMLRLATANEPDIEISDLEIKRPPPSYTFDTIQSLRKQFPTDEFVLLIGADQLPKLHTWHKIGELLAGVKTAVLPRDGSPIPENPPDKILAPCWPEIKKNVLELPKIVISATDIRQRVSQGLSISGLVHPDVERYIGERHLYSSR
ncbi:MAG TPA: nicotinate (nicotinamide) nucleotide adenylyltransferase [Phycisphaerae bacterium]|nr:nicotinate (nicotinamide) nucleotide adenylyltransferase [Phycisphaerae bacterium]